jgi:alcohol dehydrogenase class IV
VVFGWGTSSRAAAEVAALGSSRALVLSTPGQRGSAERVAAGLGLVRSLAELGMPEAGIEHAARLAVLRPCRNPADVDYGRLRGMLAAAWAGEPPGSAQEIA